MMKYVCYDGSFEGLLTAIFEIYEYKIEQPVIALQQSGPASLFSGNHTVHTDAIKADRVLNKLKTKLSAQGLSNFFAVFLSGLEGMENKLFRFAQQVIHTPGNIKQDYSNADVLFVQQVSRKVYRERHRMEAFIRFKRTADDLYYAVIEPDFNVLPLLIKHFRERYADQRWLIYDVKRKSGLYYDLQQVEVVEMDAAEIRSHYMYAQTGDGIHEEKEIYFERLWQQYFKSVNIAARKNTKLHVQHMPKRYWKYLVEKQ